MHQKSATCPAKSIFWGWGYTHFQNSLWRILLFKGRHGQGLLTAKLCCVDENTDKGEVMFCARNLTLWLRFFWPFRRSPTFLRVLRQLTWGRTRCAQRWINNHWRLFKYTFCTPSSAFCSIIWGKKHQNAG